MKSFKTPGMYIEEIPNFPPAIVSVDTAIPVFIGYTEKTSVHQPGDLLCRPIKITSLVDYSNLFGGPVPEKGVVLQFNQPSPGNYSVTSIVNNPSGFILYYALQWYFMNGGGPCYIISVGDYTAGNVSIGHLENGLSAIASFPEITLVLFPDSTSLPTAVEYYAFCKKSLSLCAEMPHRFTIMDVWIPDNDGTDPVRTLREADLGLVSVRRFGAAYYPRIMVSMIYHHAGDESIALQGLGHLTPGQTLASLAQDFPELYIKGKDALRAMEMLLPASPAVAAKYVETDSRRGVWKSPANIGLNLVRRVEIPISDSGQEQLNMDPVEGKSINAIRSFPGRGQAIIWGARTLAGNDNEWRYVSVRRFFNMVEASVKQGIERFAFEHNRQETWIKARAMVENFLALQWRAGALQGATTRDAFYVRAGLGETMTQLDIEEGRMILEIGMAVVRPAEFIIFRVKQKMMQE
jgi:hypothetical protein